MKDYMNSGFENQVVDQNIAAIADKAYLLRESNPEESKKLLLEGLTNYPDNELLQNELLYVINYSENPDETIAVASNLAENAQNCEIRYNALRFLAYAYKMKGNMHEAAKAISKIPELHFNKLTEIAYLAEGKTKFEAAEKQKWISFENLVQMMWKLAEYYKSKGDIQNAIAETEKALKLISVESNKNFEIYKDFLQNQLKSMKRETE